MDFAGKKLSAVCVAPSNNKISYWLKQRAISTKRIPNIQWKIATKSLLERITKQKQNKHKSKRYVFLLAEPLGDRFSLFLTSLLFFSSLRESQFLRCLNTLIIKFIVKMSKLHKEQQSYCRNGDWFKMNINNWNKMLK